jgi:PhnB protein
MQVQAYLSFDGRAEEAIEFYKKALGAKVGMLMRWKDSPDPAMRIPGADNKVMHAYVNIGETGVMMSDGHAKGAPKFEGFNLSIATKTAAEADKLFSALLEGGKVTMPQTKTFFSERFGMLTDKFGISWMILVESPQGN